MKASPLSEGMNSLNILKKEFLSSTVATLLPSLNEGFMGLREKHSAYSKLFILFFNEDLHFIWDSEKYIWGWFSVPPYCSTYAICSYESIEGNDETLWIVNPRTFQSVEEVR